MSDTLDLISTRFTLDQPVSADPAEVAAAAASWLGGPVEAATVLVLRGRSGVRYEVRGQLPCPLDAVARVLVEHAAAHAVVVAIPGTDELVAETRAGQVVVSWRSKQATFRPLHRRWLGVGEPNLALLPVAAGAGEA